MTISKEERAELRRLLGNAAEAAPLPWVEYGDADHDAMVLSATGDEDTEHVAEFVDCNASELAVAAVNAAPKLLASLDAADERIAGLEAEAKHWRGSALAWAHWAASVTGESDQEIPDLTKFVATLKARIAELEAQLAEESGDFYDCAHCGERKHKSNGGDPGVYCDECSLRMGLEHTIDVQKSRIEELEAAAQWRPMATAPSDGTHVVVCMGFRDGAPHFETRRYIAPPLLGRSTSTHWRWLPIPALPEGAK